LLFNSLKNVQDLFLNAHAVSPQWLFRDFVGLHGNQVNFFDGKSLKFISFPPVQKKIFSYIKTPQFKPGLFNPG